MSLSRSSLLGGLPPVSRTAAAPAAAQPAEAVAPVVAAATPWSAIIAELGLGRADLGADVPRLGATSEPASHGWAGLIAEMGLGHGPQPAAHPQIGMRPNSSDASAAAADWSEILVEAGIAADPTPPTASFGTDPSWAMLAAEVAAERPANL